jgi:hypothetical protein
MAPKPATSAQSKAHARPADAHRLTGGGYANLGTIGGSGTVRAPRPRRLERLTTQPAARTPRGKKSGRTGGIRLALSH